MLSWSVRLVTFDLDVLILIALVFRLSPYKGTCYDR